MRKRTERGRERGRGRESNVKRQRSTVEPQRVKEVNGQTNLWSKAKKVKGQRSNLKGAGLEGSVAVLEEGRAA
eukprot:1033468-Rhodomonas_salina.1